MRVARWLVSASVVGLAALAPASLGDNAPRAQARRPAPAAIAIAHWWRLPASITITTVHASYLVERDGRADRVSGTPSQIPRGEVFFPLTNTWFRIEHGHLVVGRGEASKPLWRSAEEIEARQLGVVMIGSRAVAFQRDHRLYLAPRGGPERPVASRELPLGWARGGSGGLYTYSYPRRALLLRSDTGALVAVIAHQPFRSVYFVSYGSLYFIADGVLKRADGKRTRRLASLASVGMSTDTGLQPVGRLLELEDNRRLVVLRPDGSLFASIALREWRNGGLSSSLVVAPHGNVVAFTATTSHGSSSVETVYLLDPGAHRAVPLHTEQRVRGGGCEAGASLQWHGNWLLYSDSQGRLAAIDTAGARRVIELSGLARRLAGTGEGFGASWAGPAAKAATNG